MKSVNRQFLTWVFVFMVQIVAAQILNVEDKRVEREDTAGWFGFVDLGFNLVNNGKEVVSFRGAFRLEYVKSRHLFLSLTNYDLVKAAGQDFVNNGFQHLRYNYLINDWLTLEAFVQGQTNERINLSFRGLAGTGPRIKIVKTNEIKSWFGLLYMYEYNEESRPENVFRDHRFSSYLSFNYQSPKDVGIASITYFQPRIDKISDFRLSSQTNLSIGISSRLKFRTSFSITYDTQVPEGVVNTFYSLTNGIRWDF